MEKKKLLMEQEREELEKHISVIKGLINYHKRMVMPLGDTPCFEKDGCPVIRFENDVYLKALEASLELIERELAERG